MALAKSKTAPVLSGNEQAESLDVKKSYFSLGELWLAELIYRSAVARQAADSVEQEQILQSLFEAVRDGELRRRHKLRKHVLLNVLQKQAASFKRVQQLHAEALETWVAVDDETVAKSNEATDDVSNDKKTKKSNTQRTAGNSVLSTRKRIQHIADFVGATSVWDEQEVEKQNGGESSNETSIKTASSEGADEIEAGLGNVDIIAEIGGIDVDMFVDFSSDDEDLPLLADAVDLSTKDTVKQKVKAGVRISSKLFKSQCSVKKNKSQTKEELLMKVNNVVVLDQSSSKNAFFMDRLLYSGSLLESHYVQFAVVAGLEEDRLRASSTASEIKNVDVCEGGEELPHLPMSALVVITFDQVLHIFKLPRDVGAVADNLNTDRLTARKQEVIAPGSPPEDALLVLLKELEVANLNLKKQQGQANSEMDVSPSKLRFLRSWQPEQDTKCVQYNNLCPFLSMSLSECTIRLHNRGEHAVKISSKTENLRHDSRKLQFASSEDQRAFVEASKAHESTSVIA